MKNGYKSSEAISYARMAESLSKLNRLKEADEIGCKALAIAKQLNSLDLKRRASEVLIKVYKASKNYEKALEMTDLYNVVRDSIKTKETEKALLRSEYKYEYSKKAIEDSLKVIKDKEVLSVQIAKDRNQKIFLYI